MTSSNNSRRQFLRNTAAASAAPFVLSLNAEDAVAQAAPEYRALVCVSLGGGNDHLSTVVPFDTTSYNAYKNKRAGLALDRSTLLPITAASAQGGRTVGFSPNLTGLKSIYDAGRCAVVAGVGTLLEPTTLAKINNGTASLPPLLGSHADQGNFWFSLGTQNPYGWGGRMGDFVAASNGSRSNFTTISANGGFTQFLVGNTTNFFTAGDGGAPRLFFGGDPLEQAIIGPTQRSNLLEQAYTQVHQSLLKGATDLGTAILPENSFPAPPGGGRNPLANQLLTVARIIGGRNALGLKRQIFFVDLGGFDTHAGQLNKHPGLMTMLNDALSYFDSLMVQINTSNNVTLFTQSEFGRTYNFNGDGTDHAWGTHTFVMGGAVKGGNIYGTLPNMESNSPDFRSDGQMIPTISVEQYGATLAKWMGISSADINTVFPNLSRFNTSDLGFMKP